MAKRIIIYGPSKIGISTFLAQNKKAVFIDTFNSLGHLDVRKTKDSSHFERVVTAVDQLFLVNEKKPNDNPYDTLVIDHLFGLERLIYDYICKQNKIEAVEYLKYGKGHQLSYLELQRFLSIIDRLANHPTKPMNIIIAGHATTELYTTIYQENTAKSVLSATIKPPKENVAEYLKIWADGMFYVDDYQAVTGGYFSPNEATKKNGRYIFTSARPNFEAGNRLTDQYTIPLEWDTFAEAVNWDVPVGGTKADEGTE